MADRAPSNPSVSLLGLPIRLREIGDQVVRTRHLQDLEIEHLADVVRRCSLILHDFYSDLAIGRLPEGRAVLAPWLAPGAALLDREEWEGFRALRETPDFVRGIADKCLYDVGLVGLDVYRGVNLSDLGVRSYRLASETLGQLAGDRALRRFFRENRWTNLPLREEILFLQRCAENFRCYTEILRRLREAAEAFQAAAGGGAAAIPGEFRAPVETLAENAPMLPTEAPPPEAGLHPVPEDAGAAGPGLREAGLAELERTLLLAALDLEDLRERLKAVVVDQEEAVDVICDDLALRAAGTVDRRRPSSFLFVGPTGVGKNHLIESLTRLLEDSWRIPVPGLLVEGPQYTYPSDINDLKGATRGFIRSDEEGMLAEFHERVRRGPLGVLVVDEVEKAHPQLTRFFLSILDRGTTTDNRGRILDLRETLIVFTSNLGFEAAAAGPIGYHGATARPARSARVHGEARRSLSPEFLNRLKVVEFHPLSRESVERIFELEVQAIRERFRSAVGLDLEVTPEARAALIDRGFSERYGARHLRSVLEADLSVPVTRLVLRDRSRTGAPEAVLSRIRAIRRGGAPVPLEALRRQVDGISRTGLPYRCLRIGLSASGFTYLPASAAESRKGSPGAGSP